MKQDHDNDNIAADQINADEKKKVAYMCLQKTKKILKKMINNIILAEIGQRKFRDPVGARL